MSALDKRYLEVCKLKDQALTDLLDYISQRGEYKFSPAEDPVEVTHRFKIKSYEQEAEALKKSIENSCDSYCD